MVKKGKHDKKKGMKKNGILNAEKKEKRLSGNKFAYGFKKFRFVDSNSENNAD